jgi:hypothetical protein
MHSKLRSTAGTWALAGGVVLALGGTPPAVAKDGRNAAIIAGAAIAAAAVAAASRSHQSEYYQPYYGQPYPAPAPGYPPPPGYGYAPTAVFHPYPGVTCYPAQRSCYKANGNYSPTISARIYGY